MAAATPNADSAVAEPVRTDEVRPEEEDAARVRALDFAQPTKFTTDIRRRISAALSPSCDALTAYLTGELKVEVELELAEISQHTFVAARAALPADSVAVGIHQPGAEAPDLLLSVELAWMMQALECLLGGRASAAPQARRLTDLDRTLVEGLLDMIVTEVGAAWVELGGPELSRGEIDVEGDAGLLIAPGEPTLSVALSSRIDGAGAGMTLLVPWATFAPLVQSAQNKPAASYSPRAEHDAAELRRGVAGAQVLLRAEVGSLQMPIESLLELAPGALVTLSERAEDGVRLYAEEIAVGRGRPGRSGTRRAVKVQITGEPPERAQTYARLGRAELERARAWAGGARDGDERPAVLRSIFVRVWAELGRTHISLGDALDLASGAVVELDQLADAPVELFANGLCVASGSLVVTPEGTWGVQLTSLL